MCTSGHIDCDGLLVPMLQESLPMEFSHCQLRRPVVRLRPSILGSHRGFTLVELLSVVVVMLLILGMLAPAFTGMERAQAVTKVAYDVADSIEQARTYAMANNTYVYLGFAEADSARPASAVPQAITSSSCGRVAVAMVATKDGTSGYASGGLGGWVSNYASGIATNLTPLKNLQYFDNTHLVNLGANPPASGGMARPAVANTSYVITNSTCASSTPFAWPVGTPLDGGWQYRFSSVIQFDPQGVARIQTSANASNNIPSYIEIALQKTHGNVVPAVPADQNSGNQVAIQINAVTGSARVYRP